MRKLQLTILKILNWLNLICFKKTEHLNEFNAVYKLNNSECNQYIFVILYSNMDSN